jgi:hypothetical protein
MLMLCVRTATLTLYLHDALCNSAQYIAHIHTFLKMSCYQPQRHVDAVGCHTFLIWLIGMFVFDILQIPSGCIHLYSRLGYSHGLQHITDRGMCSLVRDIQLAHALTLVSQKLCTWRQYEILSSYPTKFAGPTRREV